MGDWRGGLYQVLVGAGRLEDAGLGGLCWDGVSLPGVHSVKVWKA